MEASIILLPDTQHYTDERANRFEAQTQWIVAQRDLLNIVMVLHEGDVVGHVTQAQAWQNGARCMALLDAAKIPYAVVPGNHDYEPESRDSSVFNGWFPLSRFQAMPTFVSAYEAGMSDNTVHCFSAAGIEFMVLALEFGPRDAVLRWAGNIVAAHPQRRVIVLTHGYLNAYGERCNRTGAAMDHNPHNYGMGNCNDGEEMWETFIKQHDNIDFVFCGHDGKPSHNNGDPAAHVVSVTPRGHTIHQMIANYQYCPWESPDDGALRILRFNSVEKRMFVRTYSPYHSAYKMDSRSHFDIPYNGKTSRTVRA
jgi:3',5'-cyclic AMP phosphodiesterase CpdA